MQGSTLPQHRQISMNSLLTQIQIVAWEPGRRPGDLWEPSPTMGPPPPWAGWGPCLPKGVGPRHPPEIALYITHITCWCQILHRRATYGSQGGGADGTRLAHGVCCTILGKSGALGRGSNFESGSDHSRGELSSLSWFKLRLFDRSHSSKDRIPVTSPPRTLPQHVGGGGPRRGYSSSHRRRSHCTCGHRTGASCC